LKKGENVAGILDPKTRIIDSVVTQEGKRQIANGGLRAVFATVSDKMSYYEYDALSGSASTDERVYFEAPSQILKDSIMMESDDSGKLLGYPARGDEYFRTDGVIERSGDVDGSLIYQTPSTFDGFLSLAEGIVTSSIDRFKNLYTIGTRDGDEPDDLRMILSSDSYTFTVNNIFPFLDGPSDATTDVDYVEPLFFDTRLANVENFKYLPPVTDDLTVSEAQTLVSSGTLPKNKMFGNYSKAPRPKPITLSTLMKSMNIGTEISGSSVISDPDADDDTTSAVGLFPWGNSGVSGLALSQVDGSSINLSSEELPRERISVFFEKTSSTNNLMMQMFELNSKSSMLKKLDVIDAGFFKDENDINHPVKKIFFVGKIFINTIGLPVFVNLFVIIMD
jgi:hypothetical protein